MPKSKSKKTIGLPRRRSAAKRLAHLSAACALAFTVTLLLNIPAAFLLGAGGNINLGDAVLLFAAGALGLPGALVAALGAAIADIAGGYVVYAPATLVIKAAAGILFARLYRAAKATGGTKRTLLRALGFTGYALILAAGYYAAEAVLLCLAGAPAEAACITALRTLLPNLIQALAAALVALPLLRHKHIPGISREE